MLHYTLLVAHRIWKKWDGESSYIHCTALTWHIQTTILSGFVKDQMQGQRPEKIEIRTAIHHSPLKAGTQFYRKGIFKLPEWWETCVEKKKEVASMWKSKESTVYSDFEHSFSIRECNMP